MPRTRASGIVSSSLPLSGTVIKVEDVTSSKDVLVKKLEKLGGRVVPRLQRTSLNRNFLAKSQRYRQLLTCGVESFVSRR